MGREAAPSPPINGSEADIAAWLCHPAVNSPELAEDIRFSAALSAANVPSGRDEIDQFSDGTAHLSWLGGPAVGPLPQWPQRQDGSKLAHVATVHLGELADVVDDKHRQAWGPGMPDRYDPSQSLPDSGALGEKVYMPLSHAYGHSWKGTTEIGDILNLLLPLLPDDDHVLLLDLESWTHLEGWFGDAGHLEVWMRRSDLATRDFGKAWCLIRLG